MTDKTAAAGSHEKVDNVTLIAELAKKAAGSEVVNIPTSGLGAGLPPAVPALFDRNDQNFDSLKPLIEAHRLLPARRTGTATATTLGSFIDLVNRHKDDHTVIFAQTAWPSPTLTAVIDYHEKEGTARWNGHKIHYEFPLTEEFKAWIENNGTAFEQSEFAAFIEEHAAELSSPLDQEVQEWEKLFRERFATPSELIDLSRGLEVHVGATAKQGVRLASGERVIEFSESHSNASGAKLEVPGLFIVSVPAFADGQPIRFPARLRYRVAGGGVKWFYQLWRWEFWLRDQVKRDLEQAARETERPGYEGAPEA